MRFRPANKAGMRKLNEELVGVLNVKATRSDKTWCGSCRQRGIRQAVVSYCTEYLDTAQVPRLFYSIYMHVWSLR